MLDESRTTALHPGAALALGMVFLALGFLVNPAFFTVALAVAGVFIALRQGNKALALCVTALTIVLMALQLGYGMGKDMAQRDNARQVPVGAAGT